VEEKMKKNVSKIVLLLVSIFMVQSCATVSSADEKNVIVKQAANDIADGLTKGTKIVLLNKSQPVDVEMTETVIEQLSDTLASKGLVLMDRKNPGVMDIEEEARETSDLDEDVIARAGQLTGAEKLITCFLPGPGRVRNLFIKTYDVQTGRMQLRMYTITL
jgi:hypothetical protein